MSAKQSLSPQDQLLPRQDGVESSQSADTVRNGIELAERAGFNARQSLEAGYPLDGPEAIEARRVAVTEKAVELAADAELDETFFARPANTVILMSVADSWLANEARSSDSSHERDPRIAAERTMLADVLLIAAGEQSGVVRSLVAAGDKEALGKYTDNQENQVEDDLRDFMDGINDEELAAAVEQVLAQDGPGSFLAAQREQFGLTAQGEKPFKVRVLRMADSRYSLQRAGMITQPEFGLEWRPNMTEEEREEVVRDARRWSEENDKVDRFARPYLDAQKEYEERFKPHLGSLAPAFVSTGRDGGTELTLQATTASLLLRYMNGDTSIDGEDERAMERELAIVRHEYGHTQRQIMAGSHHQLGKAIEERKAELVSGDHMGYQDIKYMVTDLERISGVDVIGILQESVRTEDALSAFVMSSANELGLRTALLLLATTPRAYERNPQLYDTHVNLHCIRGSKDISVMDAVLRESIEHHGDESLKRSMGEWAVRAVARSGDPAFLRTFPGYKRMQGVSATEGHTSIALEEAIAAAGIDTTEH